jgi:phosphatidylinositol phospholipase C gamma-1
MHQNEVHHSRIIVNKSQNGHKTYSLNKFISFASLYELMAYYQSHPLKSQKFKELYLTKPVPQPNSHEDKIWFYKNMTRAEAEDMLRRLRNDGAFLVRPSEKSQSQDENLFAISFRYSMFSHLIQTILL